MVFVYQKYNFIKKNGIENGKSHKPCVSARIRIGN